MAIDVENGGAEDWSRDFEGSQLLGALSELALRDGADMLASVIPTHSKEAGVLIVVRTAELGDVQSSSLPEADQVQPTEIRRFGQFGEAAA